MNQYNENLFRPSSFVVIACIREWTMVDKFCHISEGNLIVGVLWYSLFSHRDTFQQVLWRSFGKLKLQYYSNVMAKWFSVAIASTWRTKNIPSFYPPGQLGFSIADIVSRCETIRFIQSYISDQVGLINAVLGRSLFCTTHDEKMKVILMLLVIDVLAVSLDLMSLVN